MNRFNSMRILLIMLFPVVLLSKDGILSSNSDTQSMTQNIYKNDSALSLSPISKVITIYDNADIPGGVGISKGIYTKIDGYRYVNITVEFDQKTGNEPPLSLGVIFAFDESGKLGARRYFTFDKNNSIPTDPQFITVSGKNCWHGVPHNKSSYIVRLPIMGPYLDVFPFNHYAMPRKFSVVLYLTQ